MIYSVLGFKHIDFTAKDGSRISGYNIFFSTEWKGGQGLTVEKVFLSDQKAEQLGYIPSLGDDVELFYNKFGKVASLSLR